MNNKRNFGLDISRALAICLVFSNHLIQITEVRVGVFWYLAYLGVDIFFALSGFLIGGILIEMCDKRSGVLTISQALLFLVRRWFRTAPLYFVILIINFIAGKYILKTVDSLDWRFFLWFQAFYKSPPRFFGESWSLCIEEWFYFLFAVGLSIFTILSSRWRVSLQHKILWFTFFFIFFITTFRVIFSDYGYKEINITVFRLDAIAYGVLFAVIDKFYSIKNRFIWVGIIGIGLSIVGILLYLSLNKIGNFYILYYNIAGIGLAACVFFLKLAANWFKKHFYWKGITFISKTSYSIYLLNLIVIYLLSHFLPFPKILTAFICLGIVVLLSYFTYKFIEVPFLRFRDKYFKSKIIE